MLKLLVDTFQNEPEQAKLPGKEDNTAYLAPFSFCTLKFQNKHILLPNVGECLGLQEISIEKVVSNYGGILLAAKIILLEISILLIALDALDSFFFDSWKMDMEKLFPRVQVHQFGKKKRIMDMEVFSKYFMEGIPVKSFRDGKFCERVLVEFVTFLCENKLLPQQILERMINLKRIDCSGDPPFYDAAYSCTTSSAEVDFVAEENLKTCLSSKCKRLECTNVKAAEEMDCGLRNLSFLLLQSKCRVLKKTFHDRVSLSDCRQVGGKRARWVLRTHPEIKQFGLISNGAVDISLSETNRGVFAIDGEVFFAVITMIKENNLLKKFRTDVKACLKHFTEPNYETEIAIETYASSTGTTSIKRVETEIRQVKVEVCSQLYERYKNFDSDQKRSLLAVIEDTIRKLSAVEDLSRQSVELEDVYEILFSKKRKL